MIATSFLKKPWVLAVILAVALAGGSWWYFSKGSADEFQTAKAVRGDLIQTVSVTGRVKPAQSVNLAFEKGGRVARVNAKVGDRAYAGQVLVSLENADIAAQLKAEEAKLAELVSGSREEDVNIQKVKVSNAEIALGDAKVGMTNALRDAFTKSDDAIRNKVDQFISNPKSSSPQINFTVFDSQLERDIEWGRIEMEKILTDWDLPDVAKTKENLDKIKSFLDKISLAVNSLSASGSLSQTTVDSYRADVLTARTNINTTISGITSAEEKLRSAQSSLNLAQEDLALLLAGTRPEKITAQEASVENYRAQLVKTLIRAPISGIVTKQDAKVGEIVGAASSVVSLISESNFEIEANIPEADIAKAVTGNEAEATLDAYGGGIIFKAVISSIDPAETVLEGVATYKTILQFVEKDERIKSGMTANVDIITERRENVIYIPQRAAITQDGLKIVRVIDGGKIREVAVETGIIAEGNIEIVVGLNGGEEVITFIPEGFLPSSGSGFGGHF
ncbi:MAG: hypothetical protein A2931_01495 [Candidatus Niyogibacteria bacterium RIFCSPLOWO2_01_FULL_45_48]|uniref:CzcB-like barrel-sandwich hybrid domain-containing protein n=1 Tax=Candidatus Niyogibacteria bacterium RIFCSPLOWO2_01_FULL_45_48 TaxID=1801724 RepID=A0A1G2EUG2_9BACT|nr:MAG: hypothetical protein A2931_01495 [Candidatus Niyogibacteria bacterium RIFCSPLOWO2_01_FULL_45_48]OGZ29980.1 MAG: hypothetical protein A2835_02840 [Candidatus Niyogibacteria bacterium RIFCSPHIGHO2_01_FULL_45_28]